MRCDANVNRLHMTNGFQLRTFDIDEGWAEGARSDCNRHSAQLIGFQICNSNCYVSHQLNRAQFQLVSLSLVSCNNVQNSKLHSRLHSRAANQVLMTKTSSREWWINLSTINWGFFFYVTRPNPHRRHSPLFYLIFVNESLSRHKTRMRSVVQCSLIKLDKWASQEECRSADYTNMM